MDDPLVIPIPPHHLDAWREIHRESFAREGCPRDHPLIWLSRSTKNVIVETESEARRLWYNALLLLLPALSLGVAPEPGSFEASLTDVAGELSDVTDDPRPRSRRAGPLPRLEPRDGAEYKGTLCESPPCANHSVEHERASTPESEEARERTGPAKLAAKLRTNGDQEVSVTAKRVVLSSLTTPHGEIRTALHADGRFDAFVADGPGEPAAHVLTGNVQKGRRVVEGVDDRHRKVPLHDEKAGARP